MQRINLPFDPIARIVYIKWKTMHPDDGAGEKNRQNSNLKSHVGSVVCDQLSNFLQTEENRAILFYLVWHVSLVTID